MAIDSYIVNLDKKEYINPSKVSDGPRPSKFSLLVRDPNMLILHYALWSDIGWGGDRIQIVGDGGDFYDEVHEKYKDISIYALKEYRRFLSYGSKGKWYWEAEE